MDELSDAPKEANKSEKYKCGNPPRNKYRPQRASSAVKLCA